MTKEQKSPEEIAQNLVTTWILNCDELSQAKASSCRQLTAQIATAIRAERESRVDDSADLFSKALDSANARIDELTRKLEIAKEALKHPDTDELTCECGWYEPDNPDGDGKHICLKCCLKEALSKIAEVVNVGCK